MARVPVAGLINIETTLRIDGFPLEYVPSRYPFFGIGSTVSGVGYNIASALATLGDDARLLSLIGQDDVAALVRAKLTEIGLDDGDVLSVMDATAQSVILYDETARRAINVDLKDIQERTYPAERADVALRDADMAVICNINFARPLLHQAEVMGVPVATDVHAIGDLEDAYNQDYMAAAHVLFQSHENLPCSPEEWTRRLQARYGTPVVVVGCGADGAVLNVRDHGDVLHIPAVYTRPVVNTIGAGDALFSAFLHDYLGSGDAHAALRKAVVFASYKVGETGAAAGFLTAPELAMWYQRVYGSDQSTGQPSQVTT